MVPKDINIDWKLKYQ